MKTSASFHTAAIVSLFMTAVTLSCTEKYAVSAIPAQLLPADAVIRQHTARLTVKDLERSTYDVTFAVTIFSKSEQDQGEMVLRYGRYKKIDGLDGTIYDANGEEIRDLRNGDIKDYSGVDDNTLKDDSRIRSASLIHNTFPYTVEFRYTLDFDGSLNWPTWTAQSTKFPVEHTSFTVMMPKEFPVRSWCNRPDVKPVVSEDGSKTICIWDQQNLPKLSDDEAAESSYDITTMVKVAPARFQMEKHEGSMESWKEFGSWFYQLYKGKQSLPGDAQREIRTVVLSAPTDKEKIKILYEYMQSRTRYVSIQLGMGAWQPFEASYVHARGYGDCKALTNYMDALLRTAGIRAYPVLINSGNNRISMIPEFPSNQFDHVILCVPQPKDSIWLECTSQSMPFGRLGSFTENRLALLVSDSGGTVVHTPESDADENLQLRTVKAALATTGTVAVEITTAVYGNQQVDMQHALLHASPKDRQDWFLERMRTPNASLTAFSIEGLENRSSAITIRLTATLARYAALNATRLFFNPSLLTKQTYVPLENRARKSPVRLSYAYVDIDSITVTLPRAISIETIPHDVALHSSFGSFTCRTIASGDTALVYVRRTEVKGPTIPAEKYTEYRSFYREMAKADRAQVVLRLRN